MKSSTPRAHEHPERRRQWVRRALLESLERRELMTTGPMLAGVQPNEGELLFDIRQLGTIPPNSTLPIEIAGTTLTVAPRELTFRFDSASEIDPTTLDGIRITRAGADGVFEVAKATTDFGTGGAVLVEFRSKIEGASGNGQQVRITSVSRLGTRLPIIRLDGEVLEIELNSNPSSPTRVQELLQSVAASPEASARIESLLISGPSLTEIGVRSGNRTLTLQGANAAQGLTDFGLGGNTLVRFLAVNAGQEGVGVSIRVLKQDFGGRANPVVTVQGKAIEVRVNSNPLFPSTVNDLINAIQANRDAAALVTPILESGVATQSLLGIPTNLPPLVLSGARDEVLQPGYVGLGDSAREVVFRFRENLPDDRYRIDILGTGASALLDVRGDAANGGRDMGISFDLNLGPKVLAVVPEPVRRGASNQLTRDSGVIEVYFNEDELSLASAQNVNFYQLIFRDSTGAERAFKPQSVQYSTVTRIATLRFPNALARFTDPSAPGKFLQGPFRLQIGTSEPLPAAPVRVDVPSEPGDAFTSAFNLSASAGNFTTETKSLVVEGAIANTQAFPFEMPGNIDSPGRRELRAEDISRFSGPLPLDYYRSDAPDSAPGISQFFYNFAPSYNGFDPANLAGTKTYLNIITEEQKQRVREVLSLFSEYLGVQFAESANLGMTIVVGDLASVSRGDVSGPGGVIGGVRSDGNPFSGEIVLDFQDFDRAIDDRFGESFSRGAMLMIGQGLGYGYTDGLPQPTSMSSAFVFSDDTQGDPLYPGVADILHGRFLYRPESTDIDLYSFRMETAGRVTAETFAERRAGDVSLLDSHLRLYRRLDSGQYEEVAANDNYSSNDSLIDIELPSGNYVIGVSASGNDAYDPVIPGTGFGGKSQGTYQLRLTVRPTIPQGLVDVTGVPIDGDADGRPGGIFNFWHNPADPLNPGLRATEVAAGLPVTPGTIYVDKIASAFGADGSLAKPFKNLSDGLAIARPGDVVRIVANGGTDGLVSTEQDNQSYQIGINSLGQTLADGRNLEIPQGVTVVVDAGVVMKFRQSYVAVGSTSPTINRSGAALQILGTPILVERSTGEIVADGSVILTSYNDTSAGTSNAPTNLTPRAGDWGGIDFRGNFDSADRERRNLEAEGLFLNQIYGAEIRYGGGQVSVAGQPLALSPIEIDVTRPTIAYSRIRNSASAAITASPDSFAESTFVEFIAPGVTGSTPSVSRIGPDIHSNTLVDNSINGLFIRVRTRSGETTQPLTVQGRFDDTDIVHVLTENLVIQGTPGGPRVDRDGPPSLLITSTPSTTSGLLEAGTYVYQLTYVDAVGNESVSSRSTFPVTLTAQGQVQLAQLPQVPAGSSYVGRRLYRATVDALGNPGTFNRVGVLNATSTSFTDSGSILGPAILRQDPKFVARLDARLAIDPGLIIKLDGARIETSFGSQLIAEGAPSLPIVMTSLNDQRHGAAGTFKTDGQSLIPGLVEGDWGGIYVGYAGTASLDHVLVAGAGGITRIDGGFASFNPIEVHQGDLRLTNSRLELNNTGIELQSGNRGGFGTNREGSIFVRGAQPVIIGNQIVTGQGPAISIDLNSMLHHSNRDSGRSTGGLGAFDIRGNVGPIIADNRLDNNFLNGMVVRGGQATSEIVFDDTDIAHIVLDTIEIPNQHIFGGMRLQSSPDASLLVKFESRTGVPAGIVVGGTFQSALSSLGDIDDRIGGSLQLVGFPDFPVILTTLSDDSVGAGFDLDGLPQVDTNNDGLFGAGQPSIDGFAQLPFGPEVNNGLRIDNDVSIEIPGFFQATPQQGGRIDIFSGSGVTVSGLGGLQIDQDYIFEFLNMIDTGAAGEGFDLFGTTITQPPTLIADDLVESRGTFDGQNGLVNWTVHTFFYDGVPVLFNKVTFESTSALGSLRMISYLDEDVEGISDDILYTTGTPGEADFRAFTIDGPRRIGFSQGGYYEPGENLVNAQYIGWAADQYRELLGAIEGNGTQYTIPGNIDLADLPPSNDSRLGQIYGPNDVTTAFAWDVDPNAFSATITSFLELVPRDPSIPRPEVESGLWRGVSVREAASDRNILWNSENEIPAQNVPGVNSIPGTAQYLGEIAARPVGGDENQRLGFVVDGNLAARNDLDVYSFVGQAGTQVWFDIDRTEMSLNAVLELIDANGFVLVSSDDSAQESLDPTRLYRSPRLNASAASPMNTQPLVGQNLTSAQDLYSTNPRDPGFRVYLPGEPGTRNLYHLRVRSSNSAAGRDEVPEGPSSAKLVGGLSRGDYRLQLRLQETDEMPGTQVRFGDIRYAQTNLEVVGQPFHSPLVGDAQEMTASNNVRANSQPIGPLSRANDLLLPAAANLVASDQLSLTVGGSIDAIDDIDWYQFQIDYQSLPSGSALEYLSTIFDLDYANGFARADLSLHVYNEDGQLILIGRDSNIQDDQARPLMGTDSADLSRGSAGTGDPFIGVAELPQGTYFVAVSNSTRAPRVINGLYSTDPSFATFDPGLRLEPLTSVRRVAEDHIGFGEGQQTLQVPGSAGGPQLLFNTSRTSSQSSFVPFTLGDAVMYSIQSVGDTLRLNLGSPFNGAQYGLIGSPDLGNEIRINDIAIHPNGEIFAYRHGQGLGDHSTEYVRIDSATGQVFPLGLLDLYENDDEYDDEDAEHGFQVRALALFLGNDGLVVGQRGRDINPIQTPTVYDNNIIYRIDSRTGEGVGIPRAGGDRATGARSEITERGYINTSLAAGNSITAIDFSDATLVSPSGLATLQLRDGMGFTLFAPNNTPLRRFEFNSGPDFLLSYDADQSIYVRDGDQITVSGFTYQFETGGSIQLLPGNQIVAGATIALTGATSGLTRTFELTQTGVVSGSNIPVLYTTTMTSLEVATALAAAIQGAAIGIVPDVLGGGGIGLTGDSTTVPPVTTGTGVSFIGRAGLNGLGSPSTILVRIEEGVPLSAFTEALATSVTGNVAVGVAGNRMNFRGATGVNDFSALFNRGVITPNPNSADGSYGNATVTAGSIGIDFLASDTKETIALRVEQAIKNFSITTGSTADATATGRTVTVQNARFLPTSIEGSSGNAAMRLQNIAPGGNITGIAVDDVRSSSPSRLFAVSDTGGLWVVNDPLVGNSALAIPGNIGNLVATATDLRGINFNGMTNGPDISYVDTWTTPGTSQTRSMASLFFATDTSGRVYAFNTLGVLQPIFAGGATSVSTGLGSTDGLILSNLGENLWHVTDVRANQIGHGINADPLGVRGARAGGDSLHFARTDGRRPRLDDQLVTNTYNFPGGASGALESFDFSLAGYAPEDQPHLYFNYLLSTDGVDATVRDRDALHVYVLTADGRSTLVATNNSEVAPGTERVLLFDDATTPVDGPSPWRQARVPLAAFAGQSDLRLRIEFASAGQFSNGGAELRTMRGETYEDAQLLQLGAKTLELDYGPRLTLPGGLLISEFYDPASGNPSGARLLVTVDGQKFVFVSDGLVPAADEVGVYPNDGDDPATPAIDESTIQWSDLTSVEVASRLRAAILANRPAPTRFTGVSFNAEANDELAKATVIPRAAGATVIEGIGRLGTETLENLNDVDIARVKVLAGESISITVDRTSSGANPIRPAIRLFDSLGNQLAATLQTADGRATLTYTIPGDMDLYIGINSVGVGATNNYNPLISRSAVATTGGGTYKVEVSIAGLYDVLQRGSQLQLQGVAEAISSAPAVIAAQGSLGVATGNVRVPLDITMSADAVATALHEAIVTEYGRGVENAFSRYRNSIRLGNLAVRDAGPFTITTLRPGDVNGSFGTERAFVNDREGVYLDDFVIGFAERGELVTGSDRDVASDVFALSQEVGSSGSVPPGNQITGAYQLEIRDGSEYVRNLSATGSALSGAPFRIFDSNDRLVAGNNQIVAPSASTLLDGMTFTIRDARGALTFEFNAVGSLGGVRPGNIAIPFQSTLTGARAADQVAAAITTAINSPEAQAILETKARLATNVAGQAAGSTIDLFNVISIDDPNNILSLPTSVPGTAPISRRGDANRERNTQGVILVESSRFSFASQYGLDINHGPSTLVDGTVNPNLVRYPRNMVELNTPGLIPGVVVMSNTIAYNELGGIRITGLGDTGSNINPLAFDRIVNNTIVGGTIVPGQTTPAETFGGLFFTAGEVSFADRVVSYEPLAGGGPQPDPLFRDPSKALGSPDAPSAGPEPEDGSTTVSLGYGGRLTLEFTDNFLTGDGTAAADLVVFEVGTIESVLVEVSRDNVNFTSVGVVGGLSNRIDIDAFGFTPQDRLSFVRLTDLRQETTLNLTVGADIDAVGALSSVPADRYLALGTGIDVIAAAPTLINNVFANFDVGVRADTRSNATVSGGNAFYRNTTNLSGAASLGEFDLRIPAAVSIFVAPTDFVFDPSAGSLLIDSSISSLPQRSRLTTVLGAVGIAPSPILAPRLDVNGQLRIDDPLVDSPSGLGENPFMDRGSADRADQVGPVARVVMPMDNDATGFDLSPTPNVVTIIGRSVNAFEIQLIDGLIPNDPGPGTGIADGSVLSGGVLLLRDNVPLIEGVDYRFGYQATSNTIRLTPLAGVWQDDAAYTIRLLDRNDSVLNGSDGDLYRDGDAINVVDSSGKLTVFEIETGISLTIPNASAQPIVNDGTNFEIFDGVRRVRFEIDTNQIATGGNVIIPLRTNMTIAEVTAAYVQAINGAGLTLTATASDNVRIQLTGTNQFSLVEDNDTGLVIEGAIGVAAGYGIQIPTEDGRPLDVFDGQTFAIRRGTYQIENFEINTTGALQNPGYRAVSFPGNATVDTIAQALVNAIGGAGLGLVPTNAGFGKVSLNGDASYSIELTDTNLGIFGVPGQVPSVAVPISIDPATTSFIVAEQLAAAIDAQALSGVSTTVVGTRVIINGVVGIAGAGAQSSVTIRDRVGNLLQNNQADDTTVFTIFLGSGLDFGDAPEPLYDSLQASNGPRHQIVSGFSLGATATPDANAVPNNGDLDDGVTLLAPIYTGFDISFSVNVQSDPQNFVLDVFFDWNRDGSFETSHRFSSARGEISAGVNNLLLPVPTLGTAADGRPSYSVAGETYARFRLSRDGVASPLGEAPSGEVEDYAFMINVNPFQNPNGRLDVNASGDVSPLDALIILNALNRFGGAGGRIELDPSTPPVVPPYMNVNGDDIISPVDALMVINHLERAASGRGGGEGEGPGAGRAYFAAAPGVLGSAATMSTERLLEEATMIATPSAASVEAFQRRGPAASTATIFDAPPVHALEDVLDELAEEIAENGRPETKIESAEACDAVFELLG